MSEDELQRALNFATFPDPFVNAADATKHNLANNVDELVAYAEDGFGPDIGANQVGSLRGSAQAASAAAATTVAEPSSISSTHCKDVVTKGARHFVGGAPLTGLNAGLVEISQEASASTGTPKHPCASRNAWRQRKKRDGKRKWLETQSGVVQG
eukprot:2159627-Amphidinium_carterae.5